MILARCRICSNSPAVSDGWLSMGHGGGPGQRVIRCNTCHYSAQADEWSDGKDYRDTACRRWNKIQEAK